MLAHLANDMIHGHLLAVGVRSLPGFRQVVHEKAAAAASFPFFLFVVKPAELPFFACQQHYGPLRRLFVVIVTRVPPLGGEFCIVRRLVAAGVHDEKLAPCLPLFKQFQKSLLAFHWHQRFLFVQFGIDRAEVTIFVALKLHAMPGQSDDHRIFGRSRSIRSVNSLVMFLRVGASRRTSVVLS